MTPEVEHAKGQPEPRLEQLTGELADLRARLFEAEQQLAELAELRLRSERLDEIEESPLLRAVVGARARARLRAGAVGKGARHDLKRVLVEVVARLTGRDPDDD